MELIMLIGIPASGKSSFYKMNYFDSHMRISMDLFNTRNKEQRFLETAFKLQQRMVVDNTNSTRIERKDYIHQAKANKYVVKGYYFESNLNTCLERNERRSGKQRIERIGILSKFKNLEVPNIGEGFDALNYVRIESDQFIVNNWSDEV